jgi:hypothetical protein
MNPSISRFFAVLVVLAIVLANSGRASAQQTNIELIIDDSGSMAQHVVGGRKIDVAKKVFSGLIPDLPSDSQIAVRTYGRQRSSRDHDCSDMELMTPFGPNTSTRVLPGVNALRPNGMTPIAASLEAAAKDFAGKEGQNNIIILLTDGEEDCNGDPCAAAKAVREAGIRLQVNVIGFNVMDKERPQLQCIANAGGGKYYDARNAAELKVAASEVKERIAAAPPTLAASPSVTPTPYVKKEEPIYGDPIRGGDSYETSLAIPIGKLFHLDHPQPTHAHDFFMVPVRGGQTIVVSIAAGPSNGSIGASIMSPKRDSLAGVDIDGPRRNSSIRADVADQQDGNYYILIGSAYQQENEDDNFRVDLVNNYDANSDRDAGSSDARALEIKPGTYPNNYMSDVDKMDEFKFKADGTNSYSFKVRPSSDQGQMSLQAVDGDGVQLGQSTAPNRGAVAKLEGLKVAKPGYIYVKVTYDQFEAKGPYSLALGIGEVDSPPAPPPQ